MVGYGGEERSRRDALILCGRRRGAAGEHADRYGQESDPRTVGGDAWTELGRVLEGDEGGSGEVGRARLSLWNLRTDDQGCQGRPGRSRRRQAGGGLEEAGGRKMEVHCGYLQFGSAGAGACGAELNEGVPGDWVVLAG